MRWSISDCANLNGFNTITTGCQVIIADGIRGTDEVEVPVVNGEYCKTAYIGHAIMDADIFISLSHFKGHEATGFGGALKNIGMGCGSRAGKMQQHASGKPAINTDVCRGCRRCAKECGSDAIYYVDKKAVIDYDKCKGCGRCIGAAVLTRYTIRTAVQMNCSTARWRSMHRRSVMVVRASM